MTKKELIKNRKLLYLKKWLLNQQKFCLKEQRKDLKVINQSFYSGAQTANMNTLTVIYALLNGTLVK